MVLVGPGECCAWPNMAAQAMVTDENGGVVRGCHYTLSFYKQQKWVRTLWLNAYAQQNSKSVCGFTMCSVTIETVPILFDQTFYVRNGFCSCPQVALGAFTFN